MYSRKASFSSKHKYQDLEAIIKTNYKMNYYSWAKTQKHLLTGLLLVHISRNI
jgi:hypothetical protein